MDDEQLLEEGLEAFEKMNEELAKHQRLLIAFEKAQQQFYRDTSEAAQHAEKTVQRVEKASDKVFTASQEALRASQKAVEASKIELRSNLIWLGFIAFFMALACIFIGYVIGHHTL